MVQPDPTVAILAQLLPGSAGGIESNLLALLNGLASLPQPGTQVVIGPGGESDWLRAHVGPLQPVLPWVPIRHSVVARPAWIGESLWGMGKRVLGKGAGPLAALVDRIVGSRDQPQVTEGRKLTAILEERGVEVVHFPYQRVFQTSLPNVFEPWDLQHRHYPEFFSEREIALREDLYPTACRQASLVVTATAWAKQDLVQQLGVEPTKIAVIPRGAGRTLVENMSLERVHGLVAELGLPPRYILYPAKTWPHKNHQRLFRALARVRDTAGLTVPLVCTAKPIPEHEAALRACMAACGLDRQVIFTGYLNREQMTAVLRGAESLVFPSLFEGLGIPLLEAMEYGVPIASSHATCLPEIGGDAAWYFDPTSEEGIADAIRTLWMKSEVRLALRERGLARIRQFQWAHAAEKFRICYRYVARRPRTSTDELLLQEMLGAAPESGGAAGTAPRSPGGNAS